MKAAGLFAGIGGFELGFARSGVSASLLCEIDTAAGRVLKTRFPDTEITTDVRDLKSLPGDVDVVCAGFPCQDLSQAGRTAGLSGAQSSLVGEVFRVIARRKVPWLILENVPFMLRLNQGRAMAAIVAELEQLGYRWAYRVVNSMAFGLPQRRERVFIVASREGDPGSVLFADDSEPDVPLTDLGRLAHGFYWTEGIRGLGWAPDAIPTLKNGSTVGIPSPPAILMPDFSIIKPEIRDGERLQGFPTDWTRPAQEVGRASRRWSLVGNAVSVPVAKWLGRALKRQRSWDRNLVGGVPTSGWPLAAIGTSNGVRSVRVSTFPQLVRRPHLAEFLRFPGDPLSFKATAGFYSRTQVAKLRFPDGFLDAVRRHLEQVAPLESIAAAAE